MLLQNFTLDQVAGECCRLLELAIYKGIDRCVLKHYVCISTVCFLLIDFGINDSIRLKGTNYISDHILCMNS